MLQKEREFIEKAVDLKLLSDKQVSSVYNMYKYYTRSGYNINIVEIVYKKNFLSQAQIDGIYKLLNAKEKEQKIPKQEEKNNSIPRTAPLKKIVKEKQKTLSLNAPFTRDNISVGRVWHNFELIDEIGKGGMAYVYKAKQKAPERIVALKILKTEKLSQEMLQRFLKEARLSAKLDHPNIIKIYLSGSYQDMMFIAMTYINGMALHHYCNEKPRPLEEFLQYIEEVAKALDYAHKQGIIHRDIKPANIIISKEKTAYLMDFGIAKTMDIDDQSLTRSGQVLGTPRYMSPEQATGQKDLLDYRTDIYSLGAIIYEFATKTSPVPGKGQIEMLYNLVNKPVQKPSKYNPDIAPELEAIILKSMDYKKNNRYKSALDLANDIRCYLDGKPVVAQRELQNSFKKNILIGIACALILSIIAVFFFGVIGGPPNLDNLYLKAKESHKNKNFSKALDYIEKILKHSPKNIETLYLELKIRKENGEDFEVPKGRLYKNIKTFKNSYNIAKQFIYWKEYSYAKIFIEKGLKKALSRKNKKNIYKGKKLLGFILIRLKKYKKAFKIYQDLENINNTDPEILLGIATYYHYNKKMKRALDYINRINNTKLHSQTNLLKAKVRWHLIQKYLGRSYWLCPYIEKNLKNKKILKIISSIRANFEQVDKNNRIQEYINAMKIEEIPYNQKNWKLFQRLCKALPSKLIYQKVKVRYFIKQQMWLETLHESNRLINKFPLDPELYGFRALSQFKLGHHNQYIQDIYYSTRLDPNIMFFETLLALFFENFTVKEADLISHTLEIYLNFEKIERLIERYLFKEERKKLTAEYLHKEGKNLTKEVRQRILKGIKIKQYKLVKDIIKRNAVDERLIKSISQLQDTKNREAIKDILHFARKQQRENTLFLITQNLLRFYILNDKKYLTQIAVQKNCEQYLRNIFYKDNNSVLLRLLAAKTLLSFNKESNYIEIVHCAENKKFPINFLAAVALIEKNQSYFVPSIKNITQKSLIYQNLYAKYVPLNDSNHETVKALLSSPHESVALYAFHNIKKHIKLKDDLKKTFKGVFKRLIRSNNDEIRAMIIRSQWRIEKLGSNERSSRKRGKYQRAFFHELTGYFPILAELLESSSFKTKLAIAQITRDKALRFYLRAFPYRGEIQVAQKKIIKSLKKLMESKSPKLRFWSSSAVILWDKKQDIVKHFTNKKLSFFEKISCISILKAGMGTKTKISDIDKLLKFQVQTTDIPSNIRIKQLISIMIGIYVKMLSPESMLQGWLKKSKNPKVKIAHISGLLWAGTKASESLIRKYTKDENTFVKKAAIATLASLKQKYNKPSIPYFNKRVKKMGKEYCEYAALGYYMGTTTNTSKYANIQPRRYYRKGIEYLEKHSKRSWIFALEKAIEIYPTHKYYFELGFLYKKFKQYIKAEKCLLIAIKISKVKIIEMDNYFSREMLSIYYAVLADIYFHLGKIQEGKKAVLKSQKLDPLCSKAYKIFAKYLEKKNLYTKSANYYYKAFFSDPGDKLLLIFAAKSYAKSKKNKKAIKALQAFRRVHPINFSFIKKDGDLRRLQNEPWIQTLKKN